ncbi:MAG: hypothetical protein J6W64_02710 [Bacilli bacterium]|nr:hypothetical protein [Bacilli bacterium]
MSRRNALTQISNIKTTEMYKKQCTSLAENVFTFNNLLDDDKVKFLDMSFVNHELVCKGSIAWFMDEELGLLALPFMNVGALDLYGRPTRIQVIGKNGYTRQLDVGEYVIMYDNMSRIPLIFDVLQYAERIALIQRTIDINVKQQRTPRYWQVTSENKKSVLDALDGIDSMNDTVITYDGVDLGDINLALAPAPYVTDKLSEEKDKTWNEFLRLIGICNTTFEKKERNIKDEVILSQAGTIASRYTRYNARIEAIDKINKMFNMNIEVGYYDGLPTSLDSEVSEDGQGQTNMETKSNLSSESTNS